MQDLNYYTEAKIDFGNIAKCAERIGYQHEQYDFMGPHLHIGFQYPLNGTLIDGYCRWNESGMPDDAKIATIIREFLFRPTTCFWIQYSMTEIRPLADLLKTVLEQYGGCVESSLSFEFFTLGNLEQLIDITLGYQADS